MFAGLDMVDHRHWRRCESHRTNRIRGWRSRSGRPVRGAGV